MKSNRLSDKNFILVVIGQIISLFGNGILRFALPLYLLSITGSSAIFGIVGAVSFLPLIVLMPMGGIIADRANKRNIMVILDFATGFLILFFYMFMDTIPLVPLLVVTMMILYSIGGLYQPTVQASVPVLLDEKILVKGNGIVSSIGGLANLLSPIIGGMLFATYGIKHILLVSIACFFLSAILEIFIKLPYKKEKNTSPMFDIVKEDTKMSLNFIFRKKEKLKKVMFITCLLNAFISALIIISLPVVITERLMLSEKVYGYAQGVLAFGGLFGGILSSIFGEKLNIKSLYKYVFFTALGLIPMWGAMFFSNRPMVAYGLIIIGAFLVMCMATVVTVMIITFIQRETPENMLGKIMAFVMTVSMFALPIGQAVYGIAFEYLQGYENLVILGTALITVCISLYAKTIFITSEVIEEV
ncbi:MAG: MFS transporter [Filifactoraceae bacterium]